MLANLLKFGELKVSDVMVPRADIVAVEENTSCRELVADFREAQHSRLPVYRETLDDPTGLVHIKDVLALLAVRRRRRPCAGRTSRSRKSSARFCSCRLPCRRAISC